MAITTTRDKLRLELGDNDETAPLFYDEELDYFLDEESDDVLAARLRACEAAALKLARAYDFATDGQSYKRSQMADMYRTMAAQLREQGVTLASDPAGVSTVDVTNIDGYSQDIGNQDVTARRSLADSDFDVVP